MNMICLYLGVLIFVYKKATESMLRFFFPEVYKVYNLTGCIIQDIRMTGNMSLPVIRYNN